VKKLKRTIFSIVIALSRHASEVAFHYEIPHTHPQRKEKQGTVEKMPGK
jgi:hypothetical protein